MILAQNKELIKYTNKLKLQLSKCYKSIETISKLKKENNILQNENKDLKQENFNLKNYISNTFEVVKHLFDFPRDRLKRLVDNFIKEFQK